MRQLLHSPVAMLVVLCLLHLLATSAGTETPAAPAFQSRRISKSTASIEPQHQQQILSPVPATASRIFKRRNDGGTSTTLRVATPPVGKEGPRKTMAVTAIGQRLEQTVQQVKSRTKELRMEQEQKRVDRKLRRDKLKEERTAAAATTKPAKSTLKLTEPVNPYNLQMPDCGADGKVYNGRRCVHMSKMKPKH